jgi:putative MATE family efflux protein
LQINFEAQTAFSLPAGFTQIDDNSRQLGKTFSIVDSSSNLRPMMRMAIPALAEETLVLMVTWTDWLLASRYFAEDGDATKAAMGLMAYLMWLIPSMFSVVAIGATALIARWVGAGDFEAAKKVANQAYLVASIVSLSLMVLTAFFGQQFIALMQLKGDSADFAIRYLNIVTPLIPLIMCSQIGAACLRGAGDTTTGFLVKIVVVIVNILVSTLLVTGWGVFPQFGWEGIAIGTATGYAVGGSIILGTLIVGRAGLQLRFKSLKPDWNILSKMFRIGLPGGFDIGTLLFSQLLFLGLINSLGKASAAAHGLAVQIEACAFLPGAAFQIAAATMAGQFLGAKSPDRATKSVLLCLYIGGAIMCLGGICMYFFGIQIATFFTGDSSDPTTISVASLLKIVAFALPSLAIVMVLTGGFRGAGDTFWPFIFTAVGFFLIRIPLAIFLAFGLFEIPYTGITIQGLDWGVAGAWYAMVADLIVRSVLVSFRFGSGRWRDIKI